MKEKKCKCITAGGQNPHLACFSANVPQKQHFLFSFCNSLPSLAYRAAPPLLLLSGDIHLWSHSCHTSKTSRKENTWTFMTRSPCITKLILKMSLASEGLLRDWFCRWTPHNRFLNRLCRTVCARSVKWRASSPAKPVFFHSFTFLSSALTSQRRKYCALYAFMWNSSCPL